MDDVRRVNREIWERLYGDGLAMAYPTDAFVRVAHRLLDPRRHPRVLDYGFGSGQNLIHLIGRGFEGHGVEVSEQALASTREVLRGKGLAADLRLIPDGVLAYPDGFFDAVVAWSVLEYNDWSSLAAATVEIDRVLRPGGVFLGAMNAPGDFKHRHGTPLGDGVVALDASTGQEHARVIIFEEHDLSRVFRGQTLTVGHFEHAFGPTYARHWIVSYEKAP